MKTGLIMEGGAMRGMFTAGVLDVLMENGLVTDGAIGVSAGAVFGCNYKSHQIGRAIRYNTEYCNDKRYASFKNLFKTGNLYSEQFCYHEVPEKLDPFNEAAIPWDEKPSYRTMYVLSSRIIAPSGGSVSLGEGSTPAGRAAMTTTRTEMIAIRMTAAAVPCLTLRSIFLRKMRLLRLSAPRSVPHWGQKGALRPTTVPQFGHLIEKGRGFSRSRSARRRP